MEATPQQMLLFAAQAAYKQIAPIVSTKGDSPRTRFNDECMEKYVEMGAKTLGFDFHGERVADTVISFTKATDSTEEDVIEIADGDAARGWALDNSQTVAALVCEDGEALRRYADMHLKRTGELPDGFEVRHVVHPGEPRRVKAVTLKVDEEAVLRLAPQLVPPMAAGLLAIKAPEGGGLDG